MLEYQELRNNIQSAGYGITSTPILSLPAVQAVRDRFAPLFRGEFETGLYPDEWHWRQGIGLPTGVTREICNAWKADRTIAAIVLSPTLAAMVCHVMEWSSVRIAQDDILWKPPAAAAAAAAAATTMTATTEATSTTTANSDTTKNNNTVVGFHQDSAYISTQFEPYENNSVTVWIALDDATKETGCLEYAPGSHLWRQTLPPSLPQHTSSSSSSSSNKDSSSRRDHQTKGQHHKNEDKEGAAVSSSFHSCNADTYRSSLPRQPQHHGAQKRSSLVVAAAKCKTGHAIFHHQDVWHGSGPNQSPTRHRRAITNVTADAVTPWGSTSYKYGRYRTLGAVDLDESFFPILHAEPESGLKRTAWVDRYIGTTSS